MPKSLHESFDLGSQPAEGNVCWWVGDSSLIVWVPERRLTFVLLANSDGLSRKFDLGKDNDVRRSPFARTFLDIWADELGPRAPLAATKP